MSDCMPLGLAALLLEEDELDDACDVDGANGSTDRPSGVSVTWTLLDAYSILESLREGA